MSDKHVGKLLGVFSFPRSVLTAFIVHGLNFNFPLVLGFIYIEHIVWFCGSEREERGAQYFDEFFPCGRALTQQSGKRIFCLRILYFIDGVVLCWTALCSQLWGMKSTVVFARTT